MLRDSQPDFTQASNSTCDGPQRCCFALLHQIICAEVEAALARAAAEEAALWMEVLGDYPRKLPKKRVP